MLARQHRQTVRLGSELFGPEIAGGPLSQHRMCCLESPLQCVRISLFHQEAFVLISTYLSIKQHVRLFSENKIVCYVLELSLPIAVLVPDHVPQRPSFV
jgi:hypothetical protein